jgi:O-acetyl-ADP-ribose deacetylase (regulator of RNase III)
MKPKMEITAGDLTKQRVDAIVNPANSLMLMGGGAAGAIKRAGGEEIEREARSKAPVPVGSAVATAAGRLPARWVIHAPTMERPAMPTTARKVYLATRAALEFAESLGAESVAIPGMGTGVGGLRPGEAASAMISAIGELAPTLRKVRRIVLCDINQEMVEAWRSELSAKKML